MAGEAHSPSQQAKARKTLLGLAAVFALPIVAAMLLTLGPFDWQPGQTLNHGILLDPPMALQETAVRKSDGNPIVWEASPDKWLLLVVAGDGCADGCPELWNLTRQIQLALGGDASRVRRLLLRSHSAAFLDHVWVLPSADDFRAALSAATGTLGPEPVLSIVDHRGRLVLAYSAPYDGQGVLRDLKRLLRASRTP